MTLATWLHLQHARRQPAAAALALPESGQGAHRGHGASPTGCRRAAAAASGHPGRGGVESVGRAGRLTMAVISNEVWFS
eukprot:CAMPEP_0168463264 /NCGR_PEP_ID=MMETSP0228-20121227/54965_1 /TAXON_ID=133427 /ORGANISM="Protoceratium reticulatum, Strain CCCM 535 (=CCMP 1889)" /LENGTH=78 /DNA_ID=CAMNT_0008478713 /DNA_START=16 /DNA_END=248 /DNA_ORIENTATION=-